MSGYRTEKRFAVLMEGRRRWSRAEKLAMVAEIGSGSVSAVARKHNIASSLLFRWRRELGSAVSSAASLQPAEGSFIPVALPAPTTYPDSASVHDSTIEIVLAGNRRVIVGRDFDATALKRVIAALEAL